MPYDIHQEKTYSQSVADVHAAALKSVAALKGKFVSSKPEEYRFEVKFDKTVLGKVLGDRSQMTCVVVAEGEGSKVVIDGYPLDAIGRKLMFGARVGVTQTVINWFIEHLEKNLTTTVIE
jgi:hypothetical protein